MKKFLVLMLAVIMVLSFASCVGGPAIKYEENGGIVEETLDNYEVDTPTRQPEPETDPENAIDTPAANAAREEYSKEQEDKKKGDFYNGEATVVTIDGSKITMSYPGGKQGKTITVSFSDPEHRYSKGETYVITVRTFFVSITQINPNEQFGSYRIVEFPNDGR